MPTIEDFEVLEIEPHFATPPRVAPSRAFDLVDLSVGRRNQIVRGVRAAHVLNHEFVFNTRAELAAFIDFFHDRKGRWEPFWVPAWHEELVATAGLTATGTSISIEPVDYADVYLLGPDEPINKLGSYLWIYHEDGTVEYVKVTGATVADPEVLTLDASTPLTKTAALGTFVIGFLYFVRFMEDELTARYLDPDTSRISVAFRESLRYRGEDDNEPVEDIYEFFDYDLGDIEDITVLFGGVGWAEEGELVANYVGSAARSFFQSYTAGPITGDELTVGVGWNGTPSLALNYRGNAALDTMESYSVGAISGAGINGGSGWADSANLTTNA